MSAPNGMIDLISANGLPLVEPETIEITLGASDPGWKVTVYNNDTNTYEEVMAILMISTGCNSEEAYIEAWEVDHYGKCVVHRAKQETCETIADIISKIGIGVEAEPDELS